MKSLQQLVLGVGLALLAGLAGAQAPAEKVALNIPAQPVEEALNEFARQAGVQILFYSSVVEGLNAPSLSGSYTAEAALTQLLAQTSLRYEFINERTVAIRAKGEEPAAGKTSGVQVDAAFRVAQAETAGVSTASSTAAQTGEGESSTGLEELAEIIVTGTHIRGAPVNTSPVTVLDRAYIDSTGIGTTSGLIESLPQNFALTTQSGILVPGTSNSTVQGSSINLRGIGEGTTLTLLNGRRMALGFLGNAADITALPLSAIERVEVLTDGASALYGSDAVGGVVNFILRRDFRGAETRLRSGWADGDVNEFRVSQAVGHAWDTGNALLSVELYKRDLLSSRDRDFVPAASDVGSLFPRDKNRSALFSGRQELAQRLSLFADVLYTDRDSFNEGGATAIAEGFALDNPQINATVGFDWQPGGEWQIETAASYGRNKTHQRGENSLATGITLDTHFVSRAVQVKADGPVFSLPAGAVRVAVGVDWRSESYNEKSFDTPTGIFLSSRGEDQIVRSAFGEMSLPIVGVDNALHGIRRLNVSVAGRFDDYSSFGSSFDPKVGLMWEPLSGLRVHGAYGTSYVAPRLVDYSSGLNFAIVGTFFDPGVPSGVSRQMQVFGPDSASFKAQESENFSFGLEFFPHAIEGLQLGMSYYSIDYTDRIAMPVADPSIMLGNAASFGTLVIRQPSPTQVQEMIDFGLQGNGWGDCDFDPFCGPVPNFDPTSVEVIVDDRKRNLSVTNTSGLDLTMRHEFKTAAGDLELAINGTYILEFEQRITPTTDSFETVDTIFNPPDWRVRASLGWQRQAWSANFFVNHSDSYTDNRRVDPLPVASYTTVDGRLAYDFKGRIDSGFLSGATLAASVQNMLDKDPPRTAVLFDFSDMGFDPTNASPMGRFVALELTLAW